MKKNNNTLMYAILGGIITCFIVIGMVFMLSSKGTNSLKSNASNIQNQGEYVDEDDEEILLGDCASSCASATGTAYDYCMKQCQSYSTPTATPKPTAKPTATPAPVVNCCVNGSYRSQISASYCSSLGGRVVSNESQCATSTATPKPCSEQCKDAGSQYNYCMTQCTGKPYPTATPASVVNCCVNGSYRSQISASYCSSLGGSVVSNESACSSPTPTATPTSSSCEAGTYYDSTYSTSCRPCPIDMYCAGGTAPPRTCSEGYSVNSSRTSCYRTSCPLGTWLDPSYSTGCRPCGNDETKDECTAKCSDMTENICKLKAGCAWNGSKCSAKTFSIKGGGGTAYVTPQVCKTYTLSLVYEDGAAATAGNISWQVTGDDGHSCSSLGCTVKVCGKGCDSNPSVHISATLDGQTKSTSIGRYKYREWKDEPWNKEPDTKVYIYNTTALNTHTCVGYSNPKIENGVTIYEKKWNRCCGGSGGSTTPESPSTPVVPYCYKDSEGEYHWTSNPSSDWKLISGISKEQDCKKEETPACYKDPNGAYQWGKYANTDGYVLIASITNKDDCKKEEGYACYKNNYNTYVWVKAAPEECIKNANNCWVPKSKLDIDGTNKTCKYATQDKCEETEGYKRVAGITEPEKCVPDEAPACYVHGNEFVWGLYDRITGYYLIENITEEKDCKTPVADACYEDKNGNYVWGQYKDKEGYTLVPSVTEISQCVNDVPTPKTAANVSKLVYVFMAVLMAFGIGFIYYSTVLKKSNNQ